jgi:two-component system chemotaxis response regulator CheB
VKIRVALVDDSSFARRAIARVLSAASDIEIVGHASNGEEALALCDAEHPDVMLLDLSMPVLDGKATLARLRDRQRPPQVVVVSAGAQAGAEETLDALEAGAFDFVDKSAVPQMQMHELGTELLSKVRAAAEAGIRIHPLRRPASGPQWTRALPSVVVIGASTGGPLALKTVLSQLPADFPAPVVVAQHIAATYVPALTRRLADACALPVQMARWNLPLGHGVHVLAATANSALQLRAGGLELVKRAPGKNLHVPTIDVLFESAAQVCPGAWGVLLTGMGRDGAAGLLALRGAGGLTVAQDARTCAVYGMPRAADELNAASAVLPVHAIAAFLCEAVARTALRVVGPQSPP